MGKVKFKLKGKIEEKGEMVNTKLSCEVDGNKEDIILALVSACQEHPELYVLLSTAVDTYAMMELLGKIEKE